MFERSDKLLSVCLITMTFVVFSRPQTMENYMLPKNVIPISYDLTITPYFEFFTFAGTVIIDLKPNQHMTTKSIILHADRLEIKSIRLFSSMFGSTIIEDIECVNYEPEAQWMNITAVEPLSTFKLYTLYIAYSGFLCDDLRGFYRSSYVDSLGITRFFAVTQLRPIYARRFVPSFDEPHYKSNFTVRVWHCHQHRVVSNMPIEHVEMDNSFSPEGKILTTFQPTPKMSVFLLALAVFEFTAVVSPDGTHTSWAVPDKAKEAEYSVQMAPRLVAAMEQLAGSPFPLPKMDQIALPQLEPVAMENWGMNTYREINMLYDPATSPTRQIQNVPRFTAHEVAHYWIGNLATIDWWDWLWMSEAYAMFLEYYLPHQVEPSWRMTDQLVVDLLQPGLLGDSLRTSSPLTTQVITRAQITAKFTGLTYTKGPALIRMLRYFLTPERFQSGFRDLINFKAYNTFIPIEMWQYYNNNAEDMSLPTTVNEIMSTWTDTSGYPVVTVTRDYHTDSVLMKQEEFLVDSDNSQADPTKAWWIPLTYTTSAERDFENTRTKEWLTPNSSIDFYVGQAIFHLNTQEWFLMNIQQAGFYRVNYDEFNWNLLTTQLKTDFNGIHVINRAQLVDDSLNLARAGQLSYEMAFDLITYLTVETDYLPWQAALPSFSFLQTSLSGTPLLDRFQLFLKNLTMSRYSSIGFEEKPTDDHMTKLSRIQMVTWACYSGVEDCRSSSSKILKDFLDGKPTKMVPGLENVILCTAVEEGDASLWQYVQSYVLSRDSPPSFTYSLACSKNDSIIARYLEQTAETGDSSIWSQTFTNIISRPYNIDVALNILIKNYDFLNRRYGSDIVRRQFTEIGPALTARTQFEKITKLISINTITENDKTLLDISLALQRKLNWLKRNYDTMNNWLTEFSIQKICEDNLCVTD